MLFNIFKKIFRSRRADVSLKVFIKIFFFLFINKIFVLILKKKSIKDSCLIIFPPSLGLGDLIMLSRIVDIVKISKKYKIVKFTSLAPYLQNNIDETSFVNIFNSREIICFETFILPSPSLNNIFFSHILGKENCIGYINSSITNFDKSKLYSINFQDPYHERLIPFNSFYKTSQDTSPFVWRKDEREKLKLRKDFLNINKFKFISKSHIDEYFIVLSTYNFYEKFRPTYESILKEIKYLQKDKTNIIILGAKANKEITYNKNLELFLKENLINAQFINLTGLLNINNSLEIIAQSDEYIGANNGLANVAQMLGIRCTLIFNGPENFTKRKFSEIARFISLN